MTSTLSGRARWQRVLDARRAAREALRRDLEQGDLFDDPPKKRSVYVPLKPPTAEPRQGEWIAVLTLGDAAARLGLSRRELEAMIDAGKIETLPVGGGLTQVIPPRRARCNGRPISGINRW